MGWAGERGSAEMNVGRFTVYMGQRLPCPSLTPYPFW